LHYSEYADAQLTDLFTKDQLAKASSVQIKTLLSVYLQNNGNRKFTITPLPNYAQIGAANGLVQADVDRDGISDIILAGNFYPFRVQLGPLDASIGLLLKGNGKGAFTPLPYAETHLLLNGDIRNLISVKGAGNNLLIIAAKNNGSVQVVKLLR
jgi:hypothetical protein